MKIIVLENNIKNDPIIRSGISQVVNLCQNIGLTLDITYKTVSIPLTALPLSTDVVKNGFMVNPQSILNAVDGSEDVACMIYDWSLVPPFDYGTAKPINPSTSFQKKVNCVPMQIPEQWYGGYDWVLTQFFLHELCHALYFLTGTPNDQTHFQYAHPEYSQKQPNEYYLFLISSLLPAWKATTNPTIPTVILTRTKIDSKETLGQLRTADAKFGCDTLELTSNNNKINVSSIPKGNYICQWKFMLRDLAYHYQVMNVPGRTGIFIHAGNYFFNSLGCILVGSLPQDINKDGELDIINSRVILSSFEDKMGKKPFNLVIQ
jgi:hypothetical protein